MLVIGSIYTETMINFQRLNDVMKKQLTEHQPINHSLRNEFGPNVKGQSAQIQLIFYL